MQARAFAHDKITFAFDSEVAEIHGDTDLSGVTLRDTRTGATRELAVTGLFIAIGHDPRTELFKGQLGCDDNGYLVVQPPDPYEHPRRLRRGRRRGPHVPAGRHRGRHRLCGRAGRRALPGGSR